MWCPRTGPIAWSVWLAVLALLLTGALVAAAPLPESAWTCPVKGGGPIIQGNDGPVSHRTPFTRHAWDYRAEEGTPVVAARDGVVASVKMSSALGGPDRRFLNDANIVEIRHADGLVSVYAHLACATPPIEVGDRVLRGETIGYVGGTGCLFGVHFHFAVREEKGSVPIRFADFEGNDGVPRQGDRHRPPPGPVVPQETIDRLRRQLRAGRAAEGHGWIAVGCRILASLPELAPGTDHRYAGPARELRRALYADLAERIAKLDEGTDRALRLTELSVALDGVKGAEAPLRAVQERLDGLSREDQRRAKALRSVQRAILEGMVLDCHGDQLGAATRYAAAMRRARDPQKALLVARLRAIAAEVVQWHTAEMSRRMEEASRSGSADLGGLKREVLRVYDRARGVLREIRKALPKEKARVDELLAGIRRTAADVLDREGSGLPRGR